MFFRVGFISSAFSSRDIGIIKPLLPGVELRGAFTPDMTFVARFVALKVYLCMLHETYLSDNEISPLF